MYSLSDDTPIPVDEVDMSLFHPSRHDTVNDWLRRGGQTHKPARLIAAYLQTHGVDVVAAKLAKIDRAEKKTLGVDLSEALATRAQLEAVKVLLEQAKADHSTAVRAAYRAGATSTQLATALGLSVPRINQIVAGARS